ncbi:hypothetical protein ACFX13_017879 [Malus domestica]
MVNVNKLGYFQAITGLEDSNLCVEILNAHGWDLELAISSFTLKSISKLKNFFPPFFSTKNGAFSGMTVMTV